MQLGNPLLDADISMQAGDFLWAHGALSDETRLLQKTVCDCPRRLRETIQGQLFQECRDVFSQVYGEVGGSGGIEEQIYTGDILLPKCTSQSSSQQFMPTLGLDNEIDSMFTRRGTFGDTCLEGRIPVCFNNPKVQKALHANTTALPYAWELCGGGPLRYKITEMLISIIPLVSDLIKNRIPVVLYSGDQSGRIPLTQTRIIAENIAKDLKLVPVTKYGLWYDNRQVGGWSQSVGRIKLGKNVTNVYLTFATVRGAGHEVPFTSPSQALTVFRSILSRSPLPPSPPQDSVLW